MKLHDQSEFDLLDTALEHLRDTPVPAGPPGKLLDDLVSSLEREEAMRSVRPQSHFGWIYSTRPVMKIAAVVALLLASLSVLDWQSIGVHGLAFDEVAANLERIQNASCRMTTTSHGMESKARVLFLAPSLERVETSVADEVSTISICDLRAGKLLSLVPKQQMAVVCKMENVPESQPANGSFEQLRERIRNAQSDNTDARLLGEKLINGVSAVGFRLPDKTGSTDVWANLETALPIHVETTFSGDRTTKVVMTDFQYDIDVDPSQFSLTPPEGYVVRESTIETWAPSIEDLRDMLKFCADNNDGLFPQELVGANGVTSVVQKLLQDVESRHEQDSAEWLDAMMEYSTSVARGTAFVTFEQPKSRWHYSGGGVKLGEADRVVFWCRNPDTERFQVLRGDLKIHK